MRKLKTIEDLKEIAKNKGGKCLTNTYVSYTSKSLWECSLGHQWSARTGSILSGGWCPVCKQNGPKLGSLESTGCLSTALARGGECISPTYLGMNKKLTWKCKWGHLWEACPNHVLRGSWCPECSKGISERLCRYIFEELLDRKFPSSKPDWLINPKTGYKLELDGYCEELKLAFEYQGLHHYENVIWHKEDPLAYERLIGRDNEKKKLCVENNIKLILIPTLNLKLKMADLPFFIKNALEENEVVIPPGKEVTKLDLNKAYCLNYSIYEIAEQNIKNRKGKILFNNIEDRKLIVECPKGHQWSSNIRSLSYGSWCPECGGSKQKDLEYVKKLAEQLNGKCLSTEYINNRTKLLWECEEKHIWEACLSNINEGTWCPACSGNKKLTIKDLQNLALKRNGKCLAEQCLGSKTKVEWECFEGHRWFAKPTAIKTGTWCPKCPRRKKMV